MAAKAQTNLNLLVKDAENVPVAGATVTLKNQCSAVTTTDGKFSCTVKRPGTYDLKISFVGFKTYEKSIQILAAETRLEVVLLKTLFVTDEVLVKATRATQNAASTYKNINKENIEKNNQGRDLPYLLDQTPSVVITSDAGAGVGYTGIRIRGSDPTRVNVTINGIPYNDAESQGTFWVNMPDFASSVDNIQIQRGVGTSTNGAAAFGASINVQTNTLNDKPYGEINSGAGSFGTLKNTVKLGSGLINNKFSFDGRLSRISSDGYIDRASSLLKSYFLSGAYYGKKSLLRANVFSGTERTYQAWNGVPEDQLNFNRTFNEFTYQNQTDNYRQDHYQLLYANNFSSRLTANMALHFTHGEGYYEEFKEGETLADYGLSDVNIGGENITTTDLVRRRWLNNDFYGVTYSLDYKALSNLNFSLGGAYNEYQGNHYGQVISGQFVPEQNGRRYYDQDAFKTDFNAFAKADLQLNKLLLFADLQYRKINYEFLGFDRNLNNVTQQVALNFFNPKVGLTYSLNDAQQVYFSYAKAGKEPNRNDFTESTPESRPQREILNDFELGYRVKKSALNASFNAFAMFYKDQLVLTGQVNDVGAYIRSNVPNSYRAGIEADAAFKINQWFNIAANAAVSKNKIKEFNEFLDVYDADFNYVGQQQNVYENTDIAFSPDFIAGSSLNFTPLKSTEISFISKYVGRQFLDNTSNNAKKLNSFFVNDIRLGYQLNLKKVKTIGLSLLVNNIFSELYETNGYTFGYLQGNRQDFNYYYPQATRNFIFSLNLKF